MAKGETLSVGLVSDAGDMLEKLIKDGIVPDMLTDQTSAHDPLNGYIPDGLRLDEALELRKAMPNNINASR
jgi:urocanate hydratase